MRLVPVHQARQDQLELALAFSVQQTRKRAVDAGGATAPAAASPAVSIRYHVAWYRECGCTGIEIEAVTILIGFARKLGT